MQDTMYLWVIKQLLTSVLAVIGTTLVAVVFSLYNRRKKLEFFGINEKTNSFTIYLSRINVLTSSPLDGETLYKGYTGPAIAEAELQAAILLRDVFREDFYAKFVIVFSKYIPKLQPIMGFVEPAITTCPSATNTLNFEIPVKDNFVSIGSGVYNTLFRLHNLQDKKNKNRSQYFHFSKTSTGYRSIEVLQGALSFNPPLTREDGGPVGVFHRDIGVIEKIFDANLSRTRFYCAGLVHNFVSPCAAASACLR